MNKFKLENVKNLSKSEIEILDKLNSLDFSRVYRKLIATERGLSFLPQKAIDYIIYYKSYLLLWLINPSYDNLPMPLKIDTVWHVHILDTRLYTEHCDILFGKYKHHNPYPIAVDIDNPESSNKEKEASTKRFQTNIDKAVKIFYDYFETNLLEL